MKTFHEALWLFTTLSLLITACGIRVLPTRTKEQPIEKSASYEVVLGKTTTDQAVIDFIFKNNCYAADQFQLCKEIGMAWWTGPDKVVRTVYLYAGGDEGFKRYRGELPFGLTFYDPMWRVQEKLKNPNTDESLEQAGLPDEASSADHTHYWAMYKRLGFTIIYNAPVADQDAYIYAILVSTQSGRNQPLVFPYKATVDFSDRFEGLKFVP